MGKMEDILVKMEKVEEMEKILAISEKIIVTIHSYRPSWDKQESSNEASSSDSLCASGACQREQRPG